MPLNIAIAGAGIGGLTAAIGLARNGHVVTIYERLDASGVVGYSFRLMKNAGRCLAYIGIDPRDTGAVPSLTVRHFDATSGDLIRETVESKDGEDEDRSFSGYVSRGALSQDLTRAATEAGVKIHYAAKVVKVDVARNTMIFANGEEITADVIIGADGIHSAVRKAFVEGERANPHCSGNQHAVRFLLPMAIVQQHPNLASIDPSYGNSQMWFARDRRLIAYPIDFGNTMSVASAYPASLSENFINEQDGETAASYNKHVSLQTVLDIHADFDPRVRDLLQLADPEGFRVWPLQDLDDIGAWSSGRVTVLGDACHATLPSSFAGAAMAIEDGATLAVLLDPTVTVAEIDTRLRTYEAVRKPRTARIRDFGRGMETAVRADEAMREYLGFVGEHDAVQRAKEALAQLGTST